MTRHPEHALELSCLFFYSNESMSSGSGDDSTSEDGAAGNAESGPYRIPFTLMQLAVFQTVARTGSLTGAANSLSISQPAVSKSLSHLEQVCKASAAWYMPCCQLCRKGQDPSISFTSSYNGLRAAGFGQGRQAGQEGSCSSLYLRLSLLVHHGRTSCKRRA